MTLVDTSVWVDHLIRTNAELVQLLGNLDVLTHPDVIGELACGNLKDRQTTLREFLALPEAIVASDKEVMLCIEKRNLWRTGIGWTDAHLLTSALLTHCRLWSLDGRLQKAAAALGVAASL